jgi:hypothetical protein
VESDDTVISLKRKLSLHLGINTDTQKLVYAGAGRQLQNGRKLNFYGIQVLHVGWAGGEGGAGGLFPTFTGPAPFFFACLLSFFDYQCISLVVLFSFVLGQNWNSARDYEEGKGGI